MAKKDKKAKTPKKVAEVKVPKAWRKSAQAALEIAQNPVAREIVSAALVAGAAALAKRKFETNGPAAAKVKNADLGNLIAQGVTAFVAGLGKPPAKTPESGSKSGRAKKPEPHH